MQYSRITGVPLFPPGSFRTDPDKTVCITGHRRKSITRYMGSIDTAAEGVKKLLAFHIDMAAEAGFRYFYCGMASGTDLWAAEHIIAIRSAGADVRLIGAIPFMKHADRLQGRDLELLRYAENNADRIVLVNTDPDISYAAKSPTANLYRDRNYYMADRSSTVIAFYSGNPRSGTGQTVNYAARLGRRIFSFGNAEVQRALDFAGGDPDTLTRDSVYPENIFELPF